MIVCIFRSRLRPGADTRALEALDRRLGEVVGSVPGFLARKGFRAEDGEEIGIAEFESLEALEAWRRHPEHLGAKARREEFFAEIRIQVCSVLHAGGLR